ncbi:hypothetical protein J3R30DRAFT_3670320, partial [Lentinula aciculospora]
MPNSLSPPTIPTVPPTSYLPPIKFLVSFTETHRLQECLVYLRRIYVPNVRGSRRRKQNRSNLTGLHVSSPQSPLKTIRNDSFERAYALRWLSALTRIAPDPNSADSSDLAEIQNDAAALLAICAGTASAGTVQREFVFDNGRIEIALNDLPLSTNASDGDYFGSVGAQTWGGACVLAEEIADNPVEFFPGFSEADISERTFRVLELGAGTGLVSLGAAKVAMLHSSHRKVDIIATDYYPSVLDNLKSNIKTNFPDPSSSLTISSHFLDWSSFSSTSDSDASPLPTALGLFDLILGADIIYEPLHASWIRRVVQNTLRKPSLSTQKDCPSRNNSGQEQGGVFHLVMPLRPSFVAESNTIEQEFKFFEFDLDRTTDMGKIEQDLVIFSRETILCDAEDNLDLDIVSDNDTVSQAGEGHIVQYAYYIIGWEGSRYRRTRRNE